MSGCTELATDDESIRTRMTTAIEELLEATGTSQAQLGRALGLDPSLVCRRMRRLTRDWRATEIAHMATLFRVPADFFFDDAVEVEWLKKLQAARARSQPRKTVTLGSLGRQVRTRGA